MLLPYSEMVLEIWYNRKMTLIHCKLPLCQYECGLGVRSCDPGSDGPETRN